MIAITDPNYIDLQHLKESVDLLELVRSRGHDPVKHGSRTWAINCPFHDDAEASLVITPEEHLWQCFGCGKGGSAIDFVEHADRISTGVAIRKLADQIGLKPGTAPAKRPAQKEPKQKPRTPEQQKLLNKVVEFYHKTFFQYPQARDYLKSRGLVEPALIETFHVGFANETIKDALPPDGDLIKDLQAIGILDDKGREHFRDCVIFPVYTSGGNVGEIYGRKIIDCGKLRHLYLSGEHQGIWNHTAARLSAEASRAGGSSYLLLTESLIDAATLWQNGYKNVTACYGTNGLTQDHLTTFKQNSVNQIFLTFDADQAGKQGIAKVTPKLQAQGVEVHAVNLPGGHDINSYFCNGGNVEKFDALLKNAKHLSAASARSARDASPAPQSEITRKEGKPSVQDTAYGFQISFADRSYEVRLIETGTTKIKATIKAVTKDRTRFHIDTVDLYSARSRKTFLADVSGLYREEPTLITVDLNRIIQTCEERGMKDKKTDAIIRLTDRDRREAEKFGRKKNLLDLIAKDFEKCGYVGERTNVLLAYLAMTSRKMRRPLAMLLLSGSGSGKSALQDTVCSFCPEEDLVKLTSLTERALFYKGETALKHKVLALEEVAGAEDAAYAIRSLISAGVLVIETTIKDPMTGRLTTAENRVYGPTTVLLTTTNPRVDPETLSRFFVSTIDESRNQTKLILEAQRVARTLDGFTARLEREQIEKRHHALQRILRPLRVINPYGKLLTYTDEQLLTRRDHPKYLDLIEAIAFLHQQQKAVKHLSVNREEIEYIEVSLRDITLANELATEILGRSLDELHGPSRKLLLLIEKMVGEWAKTQNTESHCIEFSRRQVREHTRWSDYQVRTHIAQLVDLEYLVPCGGRQGSEYRYRLYWDGQGKEGERFLLGLKPVDQIRQEADLLGIKDESPRG